MKRASGSALADAAADPNRRKVTYPTYQKWRRDFDRDCKAVTWLECKTEMAGNKRYVTHLNCTICTK